MHHARRKQNDAARLWRNREALHRAIVVPVAQARCKAEQRTALVVGNVEAGAFRQVERAADVGVAVLVVTDRFAVADDVAP